jgi:hypothetical protein
MDPLKENESAVTHRRVNKCGHRKTNILAPAEHWGQEVAVPLGNRRNILSH